MKVVGIKNKTMKEIKEGEHLKNKIILKGDGDAVRLLGHGSVADNVAVIDQENNNEAHQDAFQIIPEIAGKPNRQFAAAKIRSPRIINCVVQSTGKLQGIFCSDGIIENARFTDNVISTKSQHKITLCGVFSGDFSRNYDGDGKLLPVVLNNLRIGGGEARIWVKSFKHHAYRKVIGDCVVDNRGIEHDPHGNYIEKLDLDRFLNLVEDVDYIDVKQFCWEIGEIAIKCSK